MKKYTEQQLTDSIISLSEKMLVLEDAASAAKFMGNAQRVPSNLLTGPTASNVAKFGAGAKALTGAGALMYSPDVGAGSDFKGTDERPAPWSGLNNIAQTTPAAQAAQTADDNWLDSIKKTASGVADWATTPLWGPNSTKPAGTDAAVQSSKPSITTKWPATSAEIKAFQTSHGLNPDGLIGTLTSAALHSAGATPPSGVKQATTRAPSQTAAKHATQQASQKSANVDWAAADAIYQQSKAAADAKYNQEMDAIAKQRQDRKSAEAATAQANLNPAIARAGQQWGYNTVQESYSNSIKELKSYMDILSEGPLDAAAKLGKNLIGGMKGTKYPSQAIDKATGKFGPITQDARTAHGIGSKIRGNVGNIAGGNTAQAPDTTVYDNPIKPQPVQGGPIDPRTNDQFSMPQPANTTNDQWGNLPDQSAGAAEQDQLDATNAAHIGDPGEVDDRNADINTQHTKQPRGYDIGQPTSSSAPGEQPATAQAAKPAQAPEAKPATAPAPDPAIVKIQKDLIAKGYNLKPDGIMGADTKRVLGYEKQFGSDYAAKQNAELALLKQPQPAKSPTLEHVSFGHDQELARIISLSGRLNYLKKVLAILINGAYNTVMRC